MATDSTNLADLIQRAVTQASFTKIARVTETVAEELVYELMRDQTFQASIRQLVAAAFEKALADLALPPDPDAKKRRDF